MEVRFEVPQLHPETVARFVASIRQSAAINGVDVAVSFFSCQHFHFTKDLIRGEHPILGPGNHFLFAVNARSNQISVSRVDGSGLASLDVVDQGGFRPISLSVHQNVLYVLNGGRTPDITGSLLAVTEQ